MSEGTSPVVATTAAPDAAGFVGTAARRQWRTVAARFVRHRAALVGLVLFALLLLFAFVGPLVLAQGPGRGVRRPASPERRVPVRHGPDRPRHARPDDLRDPLLAADRADRRGGGHGARGRPRRAGGLPAGLGGRRGGSHIDLVLCIPALVVTAVLARNTFTIAPGATNRSNWLAVALIIALLTAWLPIARTIRGMVLSLREKEFVEAAHALGGSTAHIVFRHILPNTVDVIIVNATVTVAQAVLLESALSFIGLGVRRPDASLGLHHQREQERAGDPAVAVLGAVRVHRADRAVGQLHRRRAARRARPAAEAGAGVTGRSLVGLRDLSVSFADRRRRGPGGARRLVRRAAPARCWGSSASPGAASR